MNAPTSDPASWFQPFVDYWVHNAPAIALAVAIVLIGWLTGRLARGSAIHLANYINRLLDRMLRRGSLASARVPNSAITVIGIVRFLSRLRSRREVFCIGLDCRSGAFTTAPARNVRENR